MGLLLVDDLLGLCVVGGDGEQALGIVACHGGVGAFGGVVMDEMATTVDEQLAVGRVALGIVGEQAHKVGIVVVGQFVGSVAAEELVGMLARLWVLPELDKAEEGEAHEVDVVGCAAKAIGGDVEGLLVAALEVGSHGVVAQVVDSHAGGVGLLVGIEGLAKFVVLEEGPAEGCDVLIVDQRVCCLCLSRALGMGIQAEAAKVEYDDPRQQGDTLFEVLDLKCGLVLGVDGENLLSILLGSGNVLVEV